MSGHPVPLRSVARRHWIPAFAGMTFRWGAPGDREQALTQRSIRALRYFQVRDGSRPIPGFHVRPKEMWVFASRGWLGIP